MRTNDLTPLARTRFLVCAFVALGVLSTASIATGNQQRVNIANSTADWQFVPFTATPVPTDIGSSYGYDCQQPFAYKTSITYACVTEYYYETPAGKPGSRRFLAYGNMTWTNLTVNPYGPGFFGTPHSVAYPASTWIRVWHSCPRLNGHVVSNMPCDAVRVAIDTGSRTVGSQVRTKPDLWPWLYRYPCSRARGWTTCTNRVGDSYRYRIYARTPFSGRL